MRKSAQDARVSTDRQVASLKATSTRYERPVAGAQGLLVVVQPSGSRQFVLRYTATSGERRRLPLGAYSTAFGLAEARRQADIHRAAVALGQDPAAQRTLERRSARTGETLDELFDAYIEAARVGLHGGRNKPRRESALAVEKQRYKAHISPKLGKRKFAQLKPADVKSFMRELAADSGLAASTVAGVGGVLRSALAFARYEMKIDHNPADRLTKPLAVAPRERLIAEADLRIIWQTLVEASAVRSRKRTKPDGTPADPLPPIEPQTALALRLIFLTLTRRGETSGAKWEEIDFGARLWCIPPARMKAGREHLVPLSDGAIAVLRLLKASTAHRESDFLFPSNSNPKQPMDGRAITRALARVTDDLELPRCSPHDARRVGATTLTGDRFRVRRFIVSHLLAHAAHEGSEITSIYDKSLYLAERREALGTWSEYLDELATQPAPQASANIIHLQPRSAS